MRTTVNINRDWYFLKGLSQPPIYIPEEALAVELPHTYNGIDGQDGGNDYYRGPCVYMRNVSLSELPPADEYYLEIQGANSHARVFLNNREIGEHLGGYSTFRVKLPLIDTNTLVIMVDNSDLKGIYPHFADFTFYGGLYRDVNIICLPSAHLDFGPHYSSGLVVRPKMSGNSWDVTLEVDPVGGDLDTSLMYRILDREGFPVANYRASLCERSVTLNLDSPRLWDGRRDPYLYTAEAILLKGDRILDRLGAKFGCRTIHIDPDRGFFLNGASYPLRGVSRHQDREDIGNALQSAHHREDLSLIYEMGANCIRLAHYQQAEEVYSLCDELGLVVWAEIPYISRHVEGEDDNAVSQMQELVAQCYNHPSIAIWGLSNEITMGGEEAPSMIALHRRLNSLCKRMDPDRYTAVASVSHCPTDAEYLKIHELVAYNHYFGWYGGDVSMNGPWLDKFHADHPTVPLGISEYGCEALDYHTSNPSVGDYTEEYQAYYHEQMIRQIFSREYLFATFVWNMFDFGADARCEGGRNGRNHKGLVTFDRRYKKDAFYAYKARLSEEPFVHICGKRYVDRVEEQTEIRVYSNQDCVELFVNGESVGRKCSDDGFFSFTVKNVGESKLVAVAGDETDESIIRRADRFNDSYLLKETGTLLNWFDIEEREGHLSIKDKISDITATKRGRSLMDELMDRIARESQGNMPIAPDKIADMIGGFTLLRFTGMLGMMNVKLTREELLELNSRLIKIKKEM